MHEELTVNTCVVQLTYQTAPSNFGLESAIESKLFAGTMLVSLSPLTEQKDTVTPTVLKSTLYTLEPYMILKIHINHVLGHDDYNFADGNLPQY